MLGHQMTESTVCKLSKIKIKWKKISHNFHLIGTSALCPQIQCQSVSLLFCSQNVNIVSNQELPCSCNGSSPGRKELNWTKVWLPLWFFNLLDEIWLEFIFSLAPMSDTVIYSSKISLKMYLRSDWFIQELRYVKYHVHFQLVK